MKHQRHFVGAVVLGCGIFLFQAAAALGQLQYTGVNLAGADFGEGNLPGTYGTHYIYPNSAEVDYFVEKGMNIIRLPFRWERLQNSANGPLNATELSRMDAVVNYATSQGATVILDPHNYARYYGDVMNNTTEYNEFADFWERVADHYKNNDKVIFGLMNEPNSMPTEDWFSGAQAAVDAIRDTGAQNMILVPGNGWSGAHSWLQNWYGSSNASTMINIDDPLNNIAFEVHQYFDDNSSGTSSTIANNDPDVGVDRITAVTQWAENQGVKLFLGEFGVANSTIGSGGTQVGDELLENLFEYMEAHDGAWLGWTWWAAGPWWGNYMFTLEPTNLGQPSETDRPAMAVLEPYLAGIEEVLLLGDVNGDDVVDVLDIVPFNAVVTGSQPYNELADMNEDDVVDVLDIALFNAAVTGSDQAQVIPEPAGLALLGLGALALLRRRAA